MNSPYEDLDYLKHIGFEEKDVLEIITLPKNSYSANRLLFLTPKELSQHESTLLLGDASCFMDRNKVVRRASSISKKLGPKDVSAKIRYFRQPKLEIYRESNHRKDITSKKAKLLSKDRSSITDLSVLRLKKTVIPNNKIEFKNVFNIHSLTAREKKFSIHARNQYIVAHNSLAEKEFLYKKLPRANVTGTDSQLYFTANCNNSEQAKSLPSIINDVSWIEHREDISEKNKGKISDTNGNCNISKINNLSVDRNLSMGNEVSTFEEQKPRKGENLCSAKTVNNKEQLQLLDPKPIVLTTEELKELNCSKDQRKRIFNISNNLGTESLKILSISSKKKSLDKVPEIYLCQRVLVMIKISDAFKHQVNGFGDSEPIETRVLERWKECFVTVKSSSEERKLKIRFSKISKSSCIIEENGLDESLNNDLNLTFWITKPSQIQLYGTLDKTICIQKNGTNSSSKKNPNIIHDNLMIYILCFSTRQNSLLWYRTIHSFFERHKKNNIISIKIPSLLLTMKLNLDIFYLHLLESQEIKNQYVLKILRTKHGYFVLPSTIIRYLNIIIFERVLKTNNKFNKQSWDKYALPRGFSFKFYDRLEWFPETLSTLLFEKNISKKGFLLEFRKFYNHSINQNFLGKTEKQLKPISTEGLILNITDIKNYKNQHMVTSVKPYYGVTIDNIFFLIPPNKGVLPDTFDTWRKKTCLELSTISNYNIPNSQIESEVNPFPLSASGNISWLKLSISNSDFEIYDAFAEDCFRRKVHNLVNSDSIIILDEVSDIFVNNVSKLNFSKRSLKLLSSNSCWLWGKNRDADEILSSIVILVNKKGKKFKFMAENQQVAEAWVKNLLITQHYWEKYSEERKQHILKLRSSNIQSLNLSEYEESNINNRTQKWVLNRGNADPWINNITSYAMLNPVLHQGYLYQKSGKYSTFNMFFAVLIPGFLLLFELFTRTISGFSKHDLHKKCRAIIPLKHSYIYSGNITEFDLIAKNHQLSYRNPTKSSLPRTYSDGWRSYETGLSRTFILWFGDSNIGTNDIFSYNGIGLSASANNQTPFVGLSKKMYCENNQNLKKRIGRTRFPSKNEIFLTRSRQEKDQWVLSIQYELDRLNN